MTEVGVKLKCLPDQRPNFGIRNQARANLGTTVPIAERGSPDPPPAYNSLTHADDCPLGSNVVVELGESSQDGLEQLPHGRVVDALGRGVQSNTEACK